MEGRNEDELLLSTITEEDYKSPVKFELEIQRKRIIYILHLMINKMEIMSYFPTMMKNDYKVLRNYLKPSDVEFIKVACSKYQDEDEVLAVCSDPSAQKLANVIEVIKMKNTEDSEEQTKSYLGSLLEKESIDFQITQVIQLITSNEPLVNYINSLPEENDPTLQTFLDCLKYLKKLMNEKLMVTSEQLMEKDKQLRIAYKSNEVIQKELRALDDQLLKQEKELNVDLNKKRTTLNTHNERLNKLKDDFAAEVSNKVKNSEKQMMADSCASDLKQSDLQKQANDLAHLYNTQLEADLTSEGLLRLKRNKLEAQLSSWLSKYDTDVGEKQTEFEKLENTHNDIQTTYNDLSSKFNEQAVDYDILMAERDEEDQRLFEEKAYQFLLNRSAKRIQRTWRAYRQRKIDRRKGKKGKGKDKKRKGKKPEVTVDRKADANEALQKAFKKKDHVFDDIDTTKEFPQAPKEVVLD